MAKTRKNPYREKINKNLDRPDLRNITFRLPEKVLDSFKKQCEKEGYKMNQVVLEMIKEYLK